MVTTTFSGQVRHASAAYIKPHTECEQTDREMANLLAKARLFSTQDLQIVLEDALDQKVSLATMLVRYELADAYLLSLCKQALQIITTGRVHEDLVVRGLLIALEKNITVTDGMMYLGWNW